MRTNGTVPYLIRREHSLEPLESITYTKQEIQQSISKAAWIDKVVMKKGTKEILPPHYSDWSSDKLNGHFFSKIVLNDTLRGRTKQA